MKLYNGITSDNRCHSNCILDLHLFIKYVELKLCLFNNLKLDIKL